MNAIRTGILQPTTLTMLCGLMIVIAATLALGAMAQDQSGQSIATVSRSFRTETGLHRNEFELIAVDQKDPQASAIVNTPLPGTLVLSFGALKNTADPSREFASLLSELERIIEHYEVEAPVREVRINISDSTPEYATSLIRKSSGILDDAGRLDPRDRMQLEIQVWAASPTQAGWIDAIRKASRLHAEIDHRLSTTGPRKYITTSSAALWPHSARVRPAMTIVLRVPVTYSSE